MARSSTRRPTPEEFRRRRQQRRTAQLVMVGFAAVILGVLLAVV